MKKILITGGSGFIGRNLKEYLRKSYLVLAPSSRQLNLLDTAAVSKYLKRNRFDVVIHCAADAVSRDFAKDKYKVVENNLLMFFNLERKSDLYSRMFYFGSGAEYDRKNLKPKMSEEYFDTHIPLDEYGFSKYVIGKYIQKSQNIYELRLFGVFGRYENWKVRFISNNICRALYDMNLSMNQNVKFDYLYVQDLCKIIEMFVKRKRLKYRQYNVCSGSAIDLVTLAKKIIKISGKDLKLRIKKKGWGSEYSGSNSRLLSEFGDISYTPIDAAIAELYAWYSANKRSINRKQLLFDQ